MTQNEMVLNHLKAGESINPDEAKEYYGIARLSARIQDLEELGYVIDSLPTESVNRFGKKVRFATYKMANMGQQELL